MKFQPDTLAGVNVITRHEAQRLWVAAEPFGSSILVPWVGPVLAWGPATTQQLEKHHFERIAELAPEVVIFGSGPRLQFVSPALLQPLIDRRIGVETMDTAAACRTYNVLVNEGRSVVAALLLSDAQNRPG
jgi:uncharacterized protein